MNSNRIRKIRREKEMSGTDIAAKLGISAQYYYSIERGTRNLSADVAADLADIFDVSVDYLLGLSDARDLKPVGPTENIPDWATSKDVADFKKMLENDQPVLFDGVPIEGENRQRVMDILSGLFWEAKELNKKTYGRKNKKNDKSDSSE
ncbi:helix-turn-helix domain-containing protein [Paenibacillus lautus]|uniref:helix-turn-helix domain-containing protein n=1 Tax=Paenibacillus lautus TaxID=1401 RepID=UPI003D2E5493